MKNDLDFHRDFEIPLNATEENLEVEFKRELDLSNKGGKAKLAQEIGALCNFGGGWIVLGRNDDGSYPDSLPHVLADINQDTINQIVSAYLIPAPHCTLRWLEQDDLDFAVPVIMVPSVGAVPVCGKKNGPEDESHQIVGVRKGIHYIRTAGPVSGPISSPEQWQDVIRKCVLSDKTQLLGALTTMMSQPSAPSIDDTNALDAQFDAFVEHWVEQSSAPERQIDPSKNFVAFGFDLIGASDELNVTIDDFKRILQTRNGSYSGPHRFFDESVSPDNRPYVVEMLETAGLQLEAVNDREGAIYDLPSMWRLSENLSGLEIVAFWEDTEWIKSAVENRSSRKWERGEKFWPAIQVRYANGFLSNVWFLAQALGFSGQVRIKVSYYGLSGRKIGSAEGGHYYSMEYLSKQDRINLDLNFEVDALEDTVRSSAVASIIQSVNKYFQGPRITPESVVNYLNSD